MNSLTLSLAAVSLAATGAIALAQSAQTAPLEIAVTNIRSGEGAVVIAAFDDAAAFEAMDVTKSVALAYLPAAASAVSVTLGDLPPGSYAVAALHDENLDGDLNMDGDVPTEGYAFTGMGPSGLAPKFSDVAIAAATDARTALRLKYWQ